MYDFIDMHNFIDIMRAVAWPVATMISVWLVGRAVSRAIFFSKRM